MRIQVHATSRVTTIAHASLIHTLYTHGYMHNTCMPFFKLWVPNDNYHAMPNAPITYKAWPIIIMQDKIAHNAMQHIHNNAMTSDFHISSIFTH